MNCFNHGEIPAIAVCKYCGKALCNACYAELESGISCHGECMHKAAEMKVVHDYLYKEAKKSLVQKEIKSVSSFLIAIGFITFSILLYRQIPASPLPPFVFVVGFVSLLASSYSLIQSSKLKKMNTTNLLD